MAESMADKKFDVVTFAELAQYEESCLCWMFKFRLGLCARKIKTDSIATEWDNGKKNQKQKQAHHIQFTLRWGVTTELDTPEQHSTFLWPWPQELTICEIFDFQG